MEFKEFFNAFNKMCEDNNYRDCPIREEKQVTSCRYLVINDPEKAEKIVKDWEKAKETEARLTNRQKFNEFFGVKIEEGQHNTHGIIKRVDCYIDLETWLNQEYKEKEDNCDLEEWLKRGLV